MLTVAHSMVILTLCIEEYIVSTPIPAFQALFYELEEYRGSNAYKDILEPWLPQALQAMAVLSRYGDAAARTWREGDSDLCNGGNSHFYSCLEHLYALSRVHDLLLLPFEPDRLGRRRKEQVFWAEISEDEFQAVLQQIWPNQIPFDLDQLRRREVKPRAAVSADEYLAWWRALGMTQIAETQLFHPFYHEIVTVGQAEDPSEPIQIVQTLWPGFLLGSMLFSRAGVVVRGGREHIVKEIAETSLLYWTYIRDNRRTTDASLGWGHNSQWGTDFRRDYVTDKAYYYNVDGEKPLFDADGRLDQDAIGDGLTPQGAIEIMTHRCLISVPEAVGEAYLDLHTYQEPRVQ